MQEFDKQKVAKLIRKAMHGRSPFEYGRQTKMDSQYIDKLLLKQANKPPTMKIIKKIVASSNGLVTLEELKNAAGYVQDEAELKPVVGDIEKKSPEKSEEELKNEIESCVYDLQERINEDEKRKEMLEELGKDHKQDLMTIPKENIHLPEELKEINIEELDGMTDVKQLKTKNQFQKHSQKRIPRKVKRKQVLAVQTEESIEVQSAKEMQMAAMETRKETTGGILGANKTGKLKRIAFDNGKNAIQNNEKAIEKEVNDAMNDKTNPLVNDAVNTEAENINEETEVRALMTVRDYMELKMYRDMAKKRSFRVYGDEPENDIFHFQNKDDDITVFDFTLSKNEEYSFNDLCALYGRMKVFCRDADTEYVVYIRKNEDKVLTGKMKSYFGESKNLKIISVDGAAR